MATKYREVRSFILTVLTLFLIIFTNGCGATIAYECLVWPECDADPSIRYFHAVKTDLALWDTPKDANLGEFGTWFHRGIIIGDTPVSFAVDTVLLPFHFLNNVFHTGESIPIEPKNKNGIPNSSSPLSQGIDQITLHSLHSYTESALELVAK